MKLSVLSTSSIQEIYWRNLSSFISVESWKWSTAYVTYSKHLKTKVSIS